MNNNLRVYFVIVFWLYIIYFWSVLTSNPPGTCFLIMYRRCKTFLHRLISVIYCNFCRSVIFTTKLKDFNTLTFLKLSYPSDGTLNSAPCQRITNPLARKVIFHWIFMKSRLVRAATKFQNWSHYTKSRRHYMAEILPIRRTCKTIQSKQ